ncbi:MAG: transporter substrate-binding domain-containing protein, partial [Deltaproteobacteria bacterium]|nr:transporter substrate-binding domain-containing protein [Deltaproteobacteria bacterium]
MIMAKRPRHPRKRYSRRPFSLVRRGLFPVSLVWMLVMSSPAMGKDPIRSAAEIDYPPFSIVDANGRAEGFSIELMRAALTAMGRDVTFRTGPWAEVRGWLERGEVQALPLVGRTPERELLFDFTFPYMSLHGAIVVRKGTTGIRDLGDLKARQVAVMKGDNAEEFLRREERGMEIHTTATFEEALQELSRGRYDAVVIQRLVALRLIQETGLANLKIVDRPIPEFSQDFCFAVKEGDRETLALLNEGLALVMADGTYRHLHAKWFAALELPSHRRIVIGGDHNYPPYEYLDEKGRPTGFVVELTRAIARAMNLDFEIRLGPWADMVRNLENGEIDSIQGMFYSPDRDLKFDFTQAYAVSHYVGVVRKGEGDPPVSLEELKGKNIVLQRGDMIHDHLVKEGLGNQVSLVGTQEGVLQDLAGGKYDCALVVRVSALLLIEKRGWTNLTLGREPILTTEYCYAVPNGHKALLAQISEGLRILDQSGEYHRIHEKWLGVYKDKPLSLVGALRYSAMVLIPLVLLFLASSLWSWSLRKKVADRTRDLQESVDRFKYVFESANVGKSMTMPNGEVNANKAFADFLGYTQDGLKGKRWQDLTPDEDIEASERIIASLTAGETDVARFEKRYVHKSGEFLWADVSVAPRRDDDGAPLYFVTTIVDITERKRAEEALRASEEFQRAMIACSPVALYSIDLDGKVLAWNESAESIFGWRAEEVIGHPLPIVTKDKEEEFAELRKRLIESGGFSGVEVVRKRKDGRLFDASLSAAPIYDERGEVIGIMASMADITELKRAEEEREKMRALLLQSQKLEAVGRLTGGIAHDFNNLLTPIIGNADMALSDVGREDPLYEVMEEIRNAGTRAATLVRQLLAFSRKQILQPEVLDLNGVVRDMERMLHRIIGEDIDLETILRPELGRVEADVGQVEQVLMNLVVNARDAMPGGGKLTIETGNVELDEAYAQNHVSVVPGC